MEYTNVYGFTFTNKGDTNLIEYVFSSVVQFVLLWIGHNMDSV